MTSLAVFHANDYNPTASRMLPASKAGVLTFYRNNKFAMASINLWRIS